MPDSLGGYSCQTEFLRRPVWAAKARIEGKGAAWAVAHRIAKLIWLIMHQGVEYQEKGSAPLHPKILQRKLGRLLKEFAKAGIDAQAAMGQALASQKPQLQA